MNSTPFMLGANSHPRCPFFSSLLAAPSIEKPATTADAAPTHPRGAPVRSGPMAWSNIRRAP